MGDDNVVYPAFSTGKVEKPEVVLYTEDAQAKKFVDLQNDKVRYGEELDQWFLWNGHYWQAMSKLDVIETIRRMNRLDALDFQGQKTLRKQMCRRRFAENIEGFARGDERCLLPLAELDAEPMYLGTPTGIYDLRTGQLIDKEQRPYVTMVTAVAPADVADDSTCPLFLRFMDQFTCGDKELRRYLLQYTGYCLTGDMREQCLIFLFGDGDNGKTVFIQIFRWLLGDYTMTAAIELFTTVSFGKHPTGFADLHRRRCVIANETQEGHTLPLDVIKDITGQDSIRAPFMRQDNFEFLPVCKLIMFGNYKPSLPDVGKAVKKRVRMVPCNLRLAASEMDRDLPAKLKKEGPGILRALLDGCLDWQRHGLVTPACVEEQTENYFANQDMFGQWLEECCFIDPNTQTPTSDLWESWSNWADHRKVKVGTEVEFSDRLEARGFTKKAHVGSRGGPRPRGWQGLGLRDVQACNVRMPF